MPPRKENETELGKAIRLRDARAESAWTGGYLGAIEAARQGNFDGLAKLLEARQPLADSDFDALAAFIAEIGRGRGQRRDWSTHQVAKLALMLRDLTGSPMSDEIIDRAHDLVRREVEEPLDREAVWNLVRNPKRLR